jgi:hypothetical protein
MWMRWLVPTYKVWVASVVVIYALLGFAGWRSSRSERETIDASVRSSPGGYRSFHFWHSGFQGGK